MLEFYYKYCRKRFRQKAEGLAKELDQILCAENVVVQTTDVENISVGYKKALGEKLYTELNNLYFSIRSGKAREHFLLKRYLPETKLYPTSNFLFADFFSGAGGLSQGIINGGFSPAFVNDKDVTSLETYYFNHALHLDRFYVGDIRGLLNEFDDYRSIIGSIKLVAGGPPCQGFSTANRQPLKEDPRNILYKDFLMMLHNIQPDWFIMENVKGMKNKSAEIEKDINDITNTTYKFTELLLNAKDFGIPQNRERFFLIGNKVGYSNSQLSANINKKSKSNRYVLKDALFGLPEIKTNPYKHKSYFESDTHGYQIKKYTTMSNDFVNEINRRTNIGYVFNHKSRYNNDNDLEIFRRLPVGENSLHPSIQDLNKYSNRNNIFKDKYFKLDKDKVSKTITSHMKHDCHMYIHPSQIRGLSPREAARIQTFSDDYFFRGSMNEWYKQIGNAVPVKLAEIISKEIISLYQ